MVALMGALLLAGVARGGDFDFLPAKRWSYCNGI